MNLQSFRRHLAHRPFWVYIVIFLLSQLTAGILAVILGFVSDGNDLNTEWTLSITLFLANALAILLFFLYKPRSVTRMSTVAGVKGEGLRRSLLCVSLAIPSIILVNIIQEAFFPNLPDLVGEETFKMIMFNPIGLFTVAVLGPISEELLFRGGVQSDLQASYASQGPIVAIGLSAVTFAIVHLNPAQMVAALILGVLLGFAYWWTGSLIAPICIHVLNNSIACMLAFISPDEDSIIQLLGGPTNAGILAVVSVFWLAITIRMVSRDLKNSREKS